MYVVKVYTDDIGVLCLFKVKEFSEKEAAASYAVDMRKMGFAVEVYQRIIF